MPSFTTSPNLDYSLISHLRPPLYQGFLFASNIPMKKILMMACLLMATLGSTAQPTIPHLQRMGTSTQLVVKGKPMLMLGGELHNSSSSGAVYMRPIWRQMAQKNLNTVLAPVYWELLEPEEGRFDFSLVDSMLLGAR